MLRVELLGGFRVSLGHRPLDGFASNKVRSLFAYLFVVKKPQPRQALAEMFWGDKSDTMANANLRVALSNLRAVAGSHLVIGRHEVGVNPAAPFELDVDRFQLLMQRSFLPGKEIDVQALEEALALYAGDLLDKFVVRNALSFDEWASWQRERLRQMALQGHYKLSLHYTELGSYDAALRVTRRLLDLEPWQEEGHRQMMLLLALTGQRSAAIAQYEACRRILASELNVEPLPETNAMLARIKAMPQVAAAPAKLRVGNPLFGRKQEYDWLLQQWQEMTRGSQRFTLVEGEMGIGKTRLVEEVLQEIAAANTLILQARCHEFSQSVAFQPLADLLRQILRRQPQLLQRLSPVWLPHLAMIVPEVYDSSSPGPNNLLYHAAELNTLHVFEAVHQTLRAYSASTSAHLAIFLDDLHWIDGASVDLLRYLIHRLAGLPVWIVGAYQAEGITPDHPFLRLRSALIAEDRASVLQLKRLTRDAIVDWIGNVAGVEEEQRERLTELVLQRGQGNPFITSQILREFRATTASASANNGLQPLSSWALQVTRIPFAVREIVMLKLGRLTPAARHLLCTAAAVGEQFDMRALAWNEPQEGLAELLNECLEKGLITVVHPHVFRFVHPMIREVAAEWLTPWQRQRIGATLDSGHDVRILSHVAGAPSAPNLLLVSSPWPERS